MKWSQILLLITSIAVGVVYAQSDAALGAASGVNVANVPDCAVRMIDRENYEMLSLH